MHPFHDGSMSKAERKRLAAESKRLERLNRGRDADTHPNEIRIVEGVSSAVYNALHREAFERDGMPLMEGPHSEAMRVMYMRQLLGKYQRDGFPTE